MQNVNILLPRKSWDHRKQMKKITCRSWRAKEKRKKNRLFPSLERPDLTGEKDRTESYH